MPHLPGVRDTASTSKMLSLLRVSPQGNFMESVAESLFQSLSYCLELERGFPLQAGLGSEPAQPF